VSRRVVIVGSGGREHALALALTAQACEVTVTPGSAGIAAGGIAVVDTTSTQLDADLFIIGPEAPLVAGEADALRAQGKLVLGPGADGAQLEGSKAFMKDLLAEASIPTAGYWTVEDPEAAATVLAGLTPPYVIKTDGLAAGKGVLVTDDLDEAIHDAADKLAGRSFGGAGSRIVIEEGLTGPECSLIALCDGHRAVAFSTAQDFKRALDGDHGPNTGGMGAYAPMPGITNDAVAELMATCVQPTLDALRARGIDYRGLLYAGLMLTPVGPKVIEFNVRFGDPETQVLLPLVESDLFDLFVSAAAGELSAAPTPSNLACVTVVLAAKGYPDNPIKGALITGLGTDGQLSDPIEGVTVIHAGTIRPEAQGPFVVNGGRVLCVTGRATTLREARDLAYQGVAQISFEGMQVRSDIAAKAAEGEQS